MRYRNDIQGQVKHDVMSKSRHKTGDLARSVCVCECESGTPRAVRVGTSSHQVVVPSVPSGVVAGFEM